MSNRLATDLKRSKYRLLGLVGQGQFGRVYCASHRQTGRLFALKELDRDRFPTHKFLRELRFLLSLQHPNIVTCHALEHTLTSRYLVMDYCQGGTLRGLMREDWRLHPAHCLKLIADVLAGLEHAHSRGIVHCDLKPENILLTVETEGWTAQISDFGIARIRQELLKADSGNTGSPAYMAPERFYGQYSYASDLYAIGIVLFELWVGRRPFSGVPAELMSAHLNQPVQVPESVPAVVRAILLTALQKLQARRFRSAAEMRQAVQQAIAALHLEPERGWPRSPLFEPSLPEALKPCFSVRQEALSAKIQQLVILVGQPTPRHEPVPETRSRAATSQEPDMHVYRASDRWVGYHCATALTIAHATVPLLAIALPEAIESIAARSRGCYVKTKRRLYFLPTERFERCAFHPKPLEPDHPLAQYEDDFTIALDQSGRWFATAVRQGETRSCLRVWSLPTQRTLERSAVRAIALDSPNSQRVQQLLTVDTRHLAVVWAGRNTETGNEGVSLQVFTRRSHWIGTIALPFPVRSLTLSSLPYRVLGLEPEPCDSILLIDLKPLRVQRLGVGIVPISLIAASWGSVLLASDGRMVLLNLQGELIGQVQGPAQPTAIAVLEPYRLLLATWNGQQGQLQVIDLRELNLDIVF